MSVIIGSPRFDLEYDIYNETGRAVLTSEFIFANISKRRGGDQDDDNETQTI